MITTNFLWDSQLSRDAICNIAAQTYPTLSFETVSELAFAIDAGPVTRVELAMLACPYDSTNGERFATRALDTLTGDDPHRHLWRYDDGFYYLLPDAQRTLNGPVPWAPRLRC